MKKFLILFFIILNILTFSDDKIKFSTKTVEQGKFLIIEYPKEKNYTFIFKNSNIKIKSFLRRGKNIALIPIHYSTPVGTYNIKIYENKREILSQRIKVTEILKKAILQ